tara:strand:- start:10 stop:168 length:159 start_codon:yes stop_codon:yes gene_type:complete
MDSTRALIRILVPVKTSVREAISRYWDTLLAMSERSFNGTIGIRKRAAKQRM